jgi:hypothetical protein
MDSFQLGRHCLKWEVSEGANTIRLRPSPLREVSPLRSEALWRSISVRRGDFHQAQFRPPDSDEVPLVVELWRSEYNLKTRLNSTGTYTSWKIFMNMCFCYFWFSRDYRRAILLAVQCYIRCCYSSDLLLDVPEVIFAVCVHALTMGPYRALSFLSSSHLARFILMISYRNGFAELGDTVL